MADTTESYLSAIVHFHIFIKTVMNDTSLSHSLHRDKMVLFNCVVSCLQCFVAVGWVAGRASGL